MEQRLTRAREILGLRRLPIKVAFLDVLPAALARWSEGPVAAGCVFWDRAMDGKSFYTLPADHWNCAIGSYTHKIGLPADRSSELGATIDFMVETRYLDAAEVAGIATLDRPPAAVAYAPASSDAFKADVVLMALNAAQTTLVYEAALKAGIASGPISATSRPSCGILPAAAKTEVIALSFGCKGNRTFTTLRDEEMYVSVPGTKWDEFLDRLVEVQRSNLTMGKYYQAQAAKFSPPK